MALATINGAALNTALKPQLALLVEDMRDRRDADPVVLARWRATHADAVTQERTAVSWTEWSEDQLTQAAVGWLLTSVFVRFCEDNLLLGRDSVWITHPDPLRRGRVIDAETTFYRANPDSSYREWLEQSFAALRANPATVSLVDEHAALHIIEPSSDAVLALLEFWRLTDDAGELEWTFQDHELTTRFLGDLYQDLSVFAQKKYALLQTPVFVEEFILDRTLEPALKDRPLEGFKLIDPTCGSGHFLLGAFDRLAARWHQHAPAMEIRSRVDMALSSIYGVDLNPFAVAIAKFRLIVAALRECGETTLVDAPRYTLNLVNGDSLLHGAEEGGKSALDYGDVAFDKDAIAAGFTYSTEDSSQLRKILAPEQYDAVVGNPPYITAKDRALNARYREIYHYCRGTYQLAVPFMEKFFSLARIGHRAGWMGQITANSFYSADFGVTLVEDYLPTLDLRLVADTSGAYLPGHATPTVIIVGRNHPKTQETVRAVLGIQGEPGTPANPADGKVWSSIVAHIDEPGYENQWISVTDLPRENLRKHPWSLAGGGAVETLAAIESAKSNKLRDVIDVIGRTTHTGLDDAFYIPQSTAATRDYVADTRPVILGEDIRDFSLSKQLVTIFPYDNEGEATELATEVAARTLWLNRTALSRRVDFQQTLESRGLRWIDHSMFFKKRFRTPLSIAFAFVATHNHFVLDRGGKVFKQTAPVIKLPEGSSEDDHLRLLGVLNSSIACFWLKSMGHVRPAAERWQQRFQCNGTVMEQLPLPVSSTLPRTRHLDTLSQQLGRCEPRAAIEDHRGSWQVVQDAHTEWARVRASMIAEQEELDWQVYRDYGLIEDDLTMSIGQAPGIALGQRAFEIVLARKIEAGEVSTEWFRSHDSLPITKIPDAWPSEYRELVTRRVATIETNLFIRLLERPEYKRRWAGETWDVRLQVALRDWLLDKLEDPAFWFTGQGTPQPRSVGELAGIMEKSPEFLEALDLWAGRRDAPVTATLVKLLADQGVPYLAAMRYKPSGLRKRAEWELVWELQRQEDAGAIDASTIPVPPKYTTADFVKTSYWSHRGKLDVPKERFIAYPDAGRATDPTLLLGWAGWNHAQQGLALATIYSARESEGMDLDELVPVVAGMAELLPWVAQWHSGVDPNLGVDLAEYLSAQLNEKSAAVGVPIADLHTWRPEPGTRGRKPSTRKASS